MPIYMYRPRQKSTLQGHSEAGQSEGGAYGLLVRTCPAQQVLDALMQTLADEMPSDGWYLHAALAIPGRSFRFNPQCMPLHVEAGCSGLD